MRHLIVLLSSALVLQLLLGKAGSGGGNGGSSGRGGGGFLNTSKVNRAVNDLQSGQSLQVQFKDGRRFNIEPIPFFGRTPGISSNFANAARVSPVGARGQSRSVTIDSSLGIRGMLSASDVQSISRN